MAPALAGAPGIAPLNAIGQASSPQSGRVEASETLPLHQCITDFPWRYATNTIGIHNSLLTIAACVDDALQPKLSLMSNALGEKQKQLTSHYRPAGGAKLAPTRTA